MRETQVIMGMPITVDILDGDMQTVLADVFSYFKTIDERFSTYKDQSEIMCINRGELLETHWSDEMKEIFFLAEQTKQKSQGYFDIRRPDGSIDPSGVVKGWAIHNAAQQLHTRGHEHFFIDAGGDMQSSGNNAQGEPWSVGIRNPFNQTQIVKVIYPRGAGVATSGTYVRGEHIYEPQTGAPPKGFLSMTVIGPNILEADLFATAAFAMGADGISFVEEMPGFEGYAIDEEGNATLTTGFESYTMTI